MGKKEAVVQNTNNIERNVMCSIFKHMYCNTANTGTSLKMQKTLPFGPNIRLQSLQKEFIFHDLGLIWELVHL